MQNLYVAIYLVFKEDFMFLFKDFLLAHHGMINIIHLSYAESDSPCGDGEEYEKWYEKTNKTFHVDMDLQHTTQKLSEFKDLIPYLMLNVSCWSFANFRS